MDFTKKKSWCTAYCRKEGFGICAIENRDVKSCILGNKEAILCAVEEMTYVFCKNKRDCAVGREDFVLSIKELMCYLGGKEEEIGWEVKVLYLKAFPGTALATIHQLD
jgi:hypothetical protein